ncbi:hypothetical protein BRD15_10950 [Halobacteriales archaeon SW_6_65_15]|nr:MAG: hypothetical protein BRD15_10950 [Halobacteriales archaeon SW_6_65_15]
MPPRPMGPLSRGEGPLTLLESRRDPVGVRRSGWRGVRGQRQVPLPPRRCRAARRAAGLALEGFRGRSRVAGRGVRGVPLLLAPGSAHQPPGGCRLPHARPPRPRHALLCGRAERAALARPAPEAHLVGRRLRRRARASSGSPRRRDGRVRPARASRRCDRTVRVRASNRPRPDGRHGLPPERRPLRPRAGRGVRDRRRSARRRQESRSRPPGRLLPADLPGVGLSDADLSRVLELPENTDVYPLLRHADALVTDYSSVYFDYLLLDRPVAFYAFDRDRYESERGFYFDYEAVAPGPVADGFAELLDALDRLLDGIEDDASDSFADRRREVRASLLGDAASNRRAAARVYEEVRRRLAADPEFESDPNDEGEFVEIEPERERRAN